MHFKQILIASLIMLSSVLPALAQPSEGESAQSLYEAIMGKTYHVKYKNGFEQDSSLTCERGGPGSTKPLGVVTNKGRIVFNSDYKKVDPKLQAEFASALHTYMKFKNGGWEGYQKYHASDVYTGDPSLGGPSIQHPDAFEKSHVPYDTLETFARDWWQQHSETYRSAFGPFKQGFIYDAILDAMQIYDYWAFGVTYFNAQKIPVYSAVFVQNQGNTITGNVLHSAGQQIGAAINYLLGYITNGGIVPPVNISAGSNTTNTLKDNVFQDQLSQDWITLNIQTPCFDTVHNSNGLFSGYADSTSTNANLNYICTDNPNRTPAHNGLGTTLTSTYQTAYNNAKNKGVLQAAWPNIFGASAGGALFGEEYTVLYIGNDGAINTTTPITADTYINSNFGCSKYFAKNMGDQGIISVPTSPTGCPSPAKITTTCVKLIAGAPYQWPEGNVLNCAGTSNSNANSIYQGLQNLGSFNNGSSYTPIKILLNKAQSFSYVFATPLIYQNAFKLASQPYLTTFPDNALGSTYPNYQMWYSIINLAGIATDPINNAVAVDTHELGHTTDDNSSPAQESASAQLDNAMQNDFVYADYSTVGATLAASTPRLPCGSGAVTYTGPLASVTNPVTNAAFCNGYQLNAPFNVNDPNTGRPYLTSTILQQTSPYFYRQTAAAKIGFNPTRTDPAGWAEWFAESFSLVNASNTGTITDTVTQIVVRNGYFACTAGTNGWLYQVTNNPTVVPTLNSTCLAAHLPTWWTIIH